MKAIVLKPFYDIATQRTYRKGASYEAPISVISEKLEKDGYIKAEKVKEEPKSSKPAKLLKKKAD